MSSARPETSAPLSSSEPAREDSTETTSALAAIGGRSYVPHIFDLINLSHRARDTAKRHVPSAFLQSEAVDSSLPLGHGASFMVTRQSIPPGPAFIKELKDMGGWTVEKVVKAPDRPRQVVYKSARVEFRPNGEPATPQDRRALQSVLTEFHALLHPPLLAHENIIDFLALAWGSNHANPQHRLPVLVVEYGDRGTLADVQLRDPPLADALKRDVCLGIALGIDALHRHGIVHGDIKPENIIMCSHESKVLVPKLADFGFAVIESGEQIDVAMGGTRTWRAPESFGPLPVSKLRLTDIYSFGLVAWSIAVDGIDPFNLMLPPHVQADVRFQEIDRLKAEDMLIAGSKLEAWTMRWNLQRNATSIASLQRVGPVSSLDSPNQPSTAASDTVQAKPPTAEFLKAQSRLFNFMASSSTAIKIAHSIRQREYYQDLEQVLASTLSRDPDHRSIQKAIEALEQGQRVSVNGLSSLSITGQNTTQGTPKVFEVRAGQSSTATAASHIPEPQTYNVTNTSEQTRHFKQTAVKGQAPAVSSVEKYQPFEAKKANADRVVTDWRAKSTGRPWDSRRRRQFSWQKARDLDPAVQNMATSSLIHLDDGPSRLTLAALIMDGYGVQMDTDRALRALAEAAAKGHPIAQAYLYRAFNACQKELPSDIPVEEYLKSQALRGSRMALMDLKELNPQEAKNRRERVKCGYGGVGANWFTDDQWRYNLSQSALLSQSFSFDSIGPRGTVHQLVVNDKGDYLLQAAAGVGAYDLIKKLLSDPNVDVNQRNTRGETALLCACRSGHPMTVKLLLDAGAEASIQSTNGESPLHWLIAFDEDIDPSAVGGDLVRRGGADFTAYTLQRISHSIFPASVDVDFQLEGTPLMWAVHDNKPKVVAYLLTLGSDPNWRFIEGSTSPLEWAAFYHYSECLKLMVEHLERTENVPITTEGTRDLRHAVLYNPLIKRAVHASDKFSMIIRNGSSYVSRLRETLEFLQAKTRLINFTIGAQNETLLHLAALHAHEEACEIILALRWRMEGLNQPAGPFGMTPILESVRWNRPSLFRLLQSHGADPCAFAISPYDENSRSWSALHVFAEQGHRDDLGLVQDLIAAGVFVDGSLDHDIETPLQVAIRRNAHMLADKLMWHGASLNVTRSRSALIKASHPLTVLGQTIAQNARHSLTSLSYILGVQYRNVRPGIKAEFVVEPARELSALHLCAMMPEGLVYTGSNEVAIARKDFDWETNRLITHELLQWFRQVSQINMRSRIQGKTALHLAAEYGNLGVIEELLALGADKTIKCSGGDTPAETAKGAFGAGETLDQVLAWLE